jgi:hypothetical protein
VTVLNFRSISAVLVSLAAVFTAVANAQDTGTTATTSGMIQLVDELDEAADGEYYCFDSFGDTVEEGDGIQTHTCKDRPEGVSEDQDWTPNSPNMGQLETTQSPGLCVQAQRIAAGAWLNVEPCTMMRVDKRQDWVAGADGQIHPASDTSLCLAVTKGVHGTCGNPDCSNFKRNVTLVACSDYSMRMDYKYITWSIPGGSIGTP